MATAGRILFWVWSRVERSIRGARVHRAVEPIAETRASWVKVDSLSNCRAIPEAHQGPTERPSGPDPARRRHKATKPGNAGGAKGASCFVGDAISGTGRRRRAT